MSGLFHVSARDHGGLLLMTELACIYEKQTYVSLEEIATSMKLSHAYLEEVAASLKRASLIEGKQGPNGGYRLSRPPAQISVEDILTALEGPLALVDCQSGSCPVEHACSSKSMWSLLQKKIRTSLRELTLEHAIR
jgi:Rrf2 family protein